MNILMVNYEYPPLGGGGGVFNKQLAEELSKNHHITVLTSQFGDLPHKEVLNGVEIVRVPVLFRKDQNAANILSMLSYFPYSIKVGRKLLKNKNFDLVHSFFAIPSAPSGKMLASSFGLPHLLSLLGGDVYDPSKKLSPHNTPFLHQTVQKMINESDVIVSLSSDIQRRAYEHYNIIKKIDLVHLGIPRPNVPWAARKQFDLSEDDLLLITVGRLVPRKGIDNLIRVLPTLSNNNVKLLILGDGPERSNLEQVARNSNVEERVKFCGYVSNDEKYQLLKLSDIYVSTSHHEGFGIVFLEAMASGLPVICYDNGGQSDFLLDEKTGHLVKADEFEVFSEKVESLCQDEERRKGYSRHNLEYMQNFYIETCANKYLNLYQSIVKKTPSPFSEPGVSVQ